VSCHCQKPKKCKPKFQKAKVPQDAENQDGWYAGCNKFLKKGACTFFRWLDKVVLLPHILADMDLSSDIKVLREDGSVYYYQKYHRPKVEVPLNNHKRKATNSIDSKKKLRSLKPSESSKTELALEDYIRFDL